MVAAEAPMANTPAKTPIAGVGVVCLRGEEVLLIRRGKPPKQGEWSLPGGRVEWGETVRAAALRELMEETNVAAELIGLVDVVDGLFASRSRGDIWGHYVLVDFAARWTGGEPRAGDDAAHAAFVPLAEVPGMAMWEETKRIIAAAALMAGQTSVGWGSPRE